MLNAIKMKVYTYILPAIVLLFLFDKSFAQSKEDRSHKIFAIKKTYQKINSYKKYNIITIDDGEKFLGNNTDNGASLTGYFTGDTLKKIAEWVGLSNRVIQNDFYFKNDQLVFVYAIEKNYHCNDSSKTINYAKLELTFTRLILTMKNYFTLSSTTKNVIYQNKKTQQIFC